MIEQFRIHGTIFNFIRIPVVSSKSRDGSATGAYGADINRKCTLLATLVATIMVVRFFSPAKADEHQTAEKKNDKSKVLLVNPVPRPASSPPPPAVAADDDLPPYMPRVARRIKAHYSPPEILTPGLTSVRFQLSRDGKVSALQIKISSGDKTMDEAALEAVRKAAPFPPFPNGAPPEITIDYTFDQSLFDGGRSP